MQKILLVLYFLTPLLVWSGGPQPGSTTQTDRENLIYSNEQITIIEKLKFFPNDPMWPLHTFVLNYNKNGKIISYKFLESRLFSLKLINDPKIKVFGDSILLFINYKTANSTTIGSPGGDELLILTINGNQIENPIFVSIKYEDSAGSVNTTYFTNRSRLYANPFIINFISSTKTVKYFGQDPVGPEKYTSKVLTGKIQDNKLILNEIKLNGEYKILYDNVNLYSLPNSKSKLLAKLKKESFVFPILKICKDPDSKNYWVYVNLITGKSGWLIIDKILGDIEKIPLRKT